MSDNLGKEVSFNFNNKGIVPSTPPDNITPLQLVSPRFLNTFVEDFHLIRYLYCSLPEGKIS